MDKIRVEIPWQGDIGLPPNIAEIWRVDADFLHSVGHVFSGLSDRLVMNGGGHCRMADADIVLQYLEPEIMVIVGHPVICNL